MSHEDQVALVARKLLAQAATVTQAALYFFEEHYGAIDTSQEHPDMVEDIVDVLEREEDCARVLAALLAGASLVANAATWAALPDHSDQEEGV